MPATGDRIEYARAGAADVESLVELRAAFLAELANVDPNDGRLLAAMRNYFQQNLASGDFLAYVARTGGEVVASSGMVINKYPPSSNNLSGREAHVMNLYTLPSHRGRGIASELLQRLIELARKSGCGRVSLHGLPRGRSIYLKAGFKPVDTEMRLNLLEPTAPSPR